MLNSGAKRVINPKFTVHPYGPDGKINYMDRIWIWLKIFREIELFGLGRFSTYHSLKGCLATFVNRVQRYPNQKEY